MQYIVQGLMKLWKREENVKSEETARDQTNEELVEIKESVRDEKKTEEKGGEDTSSTIDKAESDSIPKGNAGVTDKEGQKKSHMKSKKRVGNSFH